MVGDHLVSLEIEVFPLFYASPSLISVFGENFLIFGVEDFEETQKGLKVVLRLFYCLFSRIGHPTVEKSDVVGQG